MQYKQANESNKRSSTVEVSSPAALGMPFLTLTSADSRPPDDASYGLIEKRN